MKIRWWLILYVVAMICLAWTMVLHAEDEVVYLDLTEYNCFIYDNREFKSFEDLIEYVVIKRIIARMDDTKEVLQYVIGENGV